MEIGKENRKIIIKILDQYKDIPNRLIEIEEEIDSNANLDDNSYIRSKNKIGRKTENLAIKLINHKEYNNLKAWRELLDKLFISYDKNSLKWKFIQRRYILKDTLLYKIPKGKEIKDIYVYKDFELEGYKECIRTKKNIKDEIISDIYKEAIKIKLLDL